MKLFRRGKFQISPEQKKLRNRDRILLISSGILMGLSFPPLPFPFQLLMFAGLIPLIIVVERREKLVDINRAVYLFAFVFGLLTIYWVGSWQKESDPFLMVSGVLLVFVNPVFFLIASTLYYFARKTFMGRFAVYLLPIFWITYEYFYMLIEASFPWLTLGSGLSKFISYIQIADIIGTLGLSLLILYINVFLYKLLFDRKSKTESFISAAGALVMIVVPLIYGNYQLNNFPLSEKTIRAGILQPNLNPWDKWAGGNLDEITDLHLELSREAIRDGAEILFWPETALPVYLFGGNYDMTVTRIRNFLAENDISLITGMPHVIFYPGNDSIPEDAKYSENSGYYYRTYNAILHLTPREGLVRYYGKMKLVPFGERVPYADVIPFLGKLIKWGVGLSGWNVGKDTTVFQAAYNHGYDSVRVNGLVCYESIYPEFITGFTNKNSELIAVVTNDSWYGNSSGPYQHKEFAVLRAVENRKSVIRSANGGISTIIDPLGRTVAESEMFTRTVLTGDVILQKGTTFYSRNATMITFPASIISLFFLLVFLLKKLKNTMKI